jgi:hypothetical protein
LLHSKRTEVNFVSNSVQGASNAFEKSIDAAVKKARRTKFMLGQSVVTYDELSSCMQYLIDDALDRFGVLLGSGVSRADAVKSAVIAMQSGCWRFSKESRDDASEIVEQMLADKRVKRQLSAVQRGMRTPTANTNKGLPNRALRPQFAR